MSLLWVKVRRKGLWLSLSLLVVEALFSTRAYSQAQISFEATDLQDTSPGEDLWRYRYVLSGIAFQVNQGFSVFFSDASYRNLQSAAGSSGPDWDTLSIQPDNFLHDPGFYDAQALRDAPANVEHQVWFIWLGQGTPGS